MKFFITGEEKELVVSLGAGVTVLLLDDPLGGVLVLLTPKHLSRDLATPVLIVLVERNGSDTRVAVLLKTSGS